MYQQSTPLQYDGNSQAIISQEMRPFLHRSMEQLQDPPIDFEPPMPFPSRGLVQTNYAAPANGYFTGIIPGRFDRQDLRKQGNIILTYTEDLDEGIHSWCIQLQTLTALLSGLTDAQAAPYPVPITSLFPLSRAEGDAGDDAASFMTTIFPTFGLNIVAHPHPYVPVHVAGLPVGARRGYGAAAAGHLVNAGGVVRGVLNMYANPANPLIRQILGNVQVAPITGRVTYMDAYGYKDVTAVSLNLTTDHRLNYEAFRQIVDRISFIGVATEHDSSVGGGANTEVFIHNAMKNAVGGLIKMTDYWPNATKEPGTDLLLIAHYVPTVILPEYGFLTATQFATLRRAHLLEVVLAQILSLVGMQEDEWMDPGAFRAAVSGNIANYFDVGAGAVPAITLLLRGMSYAHVDVPDFYPMSVADRDHLHNWNTFREIAAPFTVYEATAAGAARAVLLVEIQAGNRFPWIFERLTTAAGQIVQDAIVDFVTVGVARLNVDIAALPAPAPGPGPAAAHALAVLNLRNIWDAALAARTAPARIQADTATTFDFLMPPNHAAAQQCRAAVDVYLQGHPAAFPPAPAAGIPVGFDPVVTLYHLGYTRAYAADYVTWKTNGAVVAAAHAPGDCDVVPDMIADLMEDCVLASLEHYRCLMVMECYQFLYARYYSTELRITPYAGSVPPHDLPNFDLIFRPFPGAPVAIMKIGSVGMNECMPVRDHCAYNQDYSKQVPFLPNTFYPGTIVQKLMASDGVVLGQHTDLDHLHVHLGGDVSTNKCIVWRPMY